MIDHKRILIVRPDRIGDVVLSTPIPRELKRTFPDSFVAVLVRDYTKDIFIENPNVDLILSKDDFSETGFLNLLKDAQQLRKYNFTHSLTLLPTERLNYLLFLAGIKTRIGVGHKFYQFITNTKSVYRNKYNPLRHEADYCMDTARKIGVETDDIGSEIFLSHSEREKVIETKTSWSDNKQKKIIGIHSTSGNSAPNWKPGVYRELVEKLVDNNSFQIVITDNSIPNELMNINEVIYPNINKSLRESFINFASLDLLISASTGPMHIAAALNVKTLSLFCPLTACSPKLWSPTGNESHIILPQKEYCQNQCPGDPKICNFEGENGIKSEDIIKEVNQIFK